MDDYLNLEQLSTFSGEPEREFCSDDCLRKFVVEPATYSGRGGA